MSRSVDSNVQVEGADRDDLRRLFAMSFSEPMRNDEDLRHAVLDYVRAAKASRRKPEWVMVSLKRAIIDAAAARISYRAANELTDRVVRWFIDGYYGSDPSQSERGIDLHLGPTPRVS
jgi:hypothetical protein